MNRTGTINLNLKIITSFFFWVLFFAWIGMIIFSGFSCFLIIDWIWSYFTIISFNRIRCLIAIWYFTRFWESIFLKKIFMKSGEKGWIQTIFLRGLLNFSAKSIRRRIFHVKAYAAHDMHEKILITCQNVIFCAFWRHCQALIRNNFSIANALKITFHAYAFTWQILLRKLFALKFKTPRKTNENSNHYLVDTEKPLK